MRSRILSSAFVITFCAALALPAPADGQFRRIRDAATRAVEDETISIVDQLIRDAIRCAVDDPVCPREAEAKGEEVIYVDDDGEIITDDDGAPITDRDAALATQPQTRPGEGAWANYDFVPGDEVLFFEDFSNDRVGDFPRRLEFMQGNWDVVEWEGQTLLRNLGPRHAAIGVPLPAALPSRFTIEFQAYFPHGNQSLVIGTSPAQGGERWPHYDGNGFRVGAGGSATGVISSARGGRESTEKTPEVAQDLVNVRIMVDDTYAKMYVNERRVSNIPNADFPRGDMLYLENTYFADADYPMLIGSLRVAAGGADLYSRLEAEGRVATQGILFAVDSDVIKPESTPTLEEIGRMLQDHPDMRLSIEGHTDSDGDDAHNQDLSQRRAASVKTFLTSEYAIDADRLEAAGFGESMPVADNATPEGKQQNRRVELVNLGPGDGDDHGN